MDDEQQDIDEAAFAQQEQEDEAQCYPAPFTPEWTQRMQRAQAELKRLSAFRLVWPHTKVIW